MIEFRKITHDNLNECVKLKVTKEQENFVGSNLDTLAETYVEISNGGHATPYVIYADDVMVGFIIYCYYHESAVFENNCYHIWRIMFDAKHQGKGYGKQAIEKIIAEIKTFPYGQSKGIYMSYEPENATSKHLFHSFGFVDTDKKFADDDPEIIARLSI